MSTITLTLPPSLHDQAKAMAERDQITVDQFVALAVAEKVSALLAEDYLKSRAARGERARFEQVLEKVPDVEPAAEDRLGP